MFSVHWLAATVAPFASRANFAERLITANIGTAGYIPATFSTSYSDIYIALQAANPGGTM